MDKLLNIKFWNFAKKNNSTKIPSGNWTELSCELKDDCNMIAPVLRIRNAAASISWNYCYIPGFGRYYFINDWKWVAGCWEAYCTIDALASWKTELGTETMYVLRRDSTTDFDPLITDTMYPATNDYSIQETVIPGTWAPTIANGVYIVGIISAEDTSAVGAVSYYALSSAQFGDLKDMLFSDTNLTIMGLTNGQGIMQVTDMSKEIFKTMYNPYQYIVSCIWFPLSLNSFPHGDMETTLKIGWWQYGINNYPVFAQQINLLNAEYTYIPSHPQAAARGDYLNYEPYTSIVIYGRFGTMVVDNSKVKAGWRLNFSYYIDSITGQCRVEVRSWDENAQNPNTVTLGERNFMLGVPIQLSQVGVDYLGGALATLDTAAGVMRGIRYADAGLALSSAAHGVYDTIKSKMPIMETSGANGSFLTPYKLTKVAYHFYKIVDEDLSHKGRPLCALRQLNTLSGYVLCADGEFDVSCTEEERGIIANYLTSGFFWE